MKLPPALRKIGSLFVLCLWIALAQLFTFAVPDCPTKNCVSELLQKRTITAIRIADSPPAIDGCLDEAIWHQVPVATRFSQVSPDAGAESRLRTEARVLYDQKALYVGMRMYDDDSRMIVAPFIRRDDETNCDWAFVEIDSRHDHRSGFSFGLNPRGVQTDGAWLDDTVYDSSWDGVWEGAASIDEHGWNAEFRIPFSQLPHTSISGEVLWGINFYRSSPKHGEDSVWSPRVPWLVGKVSRFNELHLETSGHEHSLEIAPFIALQAEARASDQSQVEETHRSFRGGADFKIGLGSAFTLFGAVLPDFGQVEADPSQLNLTTFELFQTERRPFFLQGMDAFRFDSSLNFVTRDNSFQEEMPFYSRRVGRAPRGQLPENATIVSRPGASTILAAIKISGQTGGWNLGVLSATTRQETATLRDTEGKDFQSSIEPMAQIELLRITKSFRDNASSFGIILSNTRHLRLDQDLANNFIQSAWLGGVDGRHRFRAQQYEVAGWLLMSHLAGEPASILEATREPHHLFQRPDAPYLQTSGKNGELSGFAAQTRLSKIGGNLRWDLFGEVISPGYDMNELGFQRNSDWLLLTGAWRYERFPSNRLIQHWVVGSDCIGLGWNWAREDRARVASGFIKIDTSNYLKINVNWVHDFSSLSTDWLRGGPALLLPARDSIRYTFVSDQRRPSYAQLDGTLIFERHTGSASWMLSPQFYFYNTTHLRWSVGLTYQSDRIGWQYITRSNSSTDPTYLVARVRQRTVTPTFRVDYAFSRHLVIQFYAQPFVSAGQYDRYQRLKNARAPGPDQRFTQLSPSQLWQDRTARISLVDLNGDRVPDFSFPTPDNLQRISKASMILRWEFRPGSFFTAVWNHQSEFTVPNQGGSLASGLNRAWSDPSTNIFLVKIGYYLSR